MYVFLTSSGCNGSKDFIPICECHPRLVILYLGKIILVAVKFQVQPHGAACNYNY